MPKKILASPAGQPYFPAMHSREFSPGRQRRIAVAVSLAVTLLLTPALFAAGPAGPKPEPLLKLSAPAPVGGTLHVEMIRGTLEIVPGDQGDATLEIHSTAEHDTGFSARSVKLTREGNVVTLRQAANEPATWRYRVTVPKKFNLELKNIQGRIAVTNFEGNVKALTTSRSIHLGHIKGDVTAESAAGAIDVRGATGTARLKSAGGKLTLGEAGGEAVMETAGGSVKIGIARGPLRMTTAGGSISIGAAFNTVFATTQGGSITAALHSQPQADSLFSTAGGSVEIKLPPKLAFNLEATSQHGQVETDLPIQWQGDENARVRTGKLNGGGPVLAARTTGGRIWFAGLKDTSLPEVAKFEFPVERPEVVVRGPQQEVQINNGFNGVVVIRGGGRFVYGQNPNLAAKPEEGPFLATGLLLRDGTSIPADIITADDTQVVFRRNGEGAMEESILTTRVSAVLLQPLPEKKRAELNHATAGLLLKNGDFLEGDCREFKAGEVTMSSVLFGLKKFEAKRTARALVFHPLPDPASK